MSMSMSESEHGWEFAQFLFAETGLNPEQAHAASKIAVWITRTRGQPLDEVLSELLDILVEQDDRFWAQKPAYVAQGLKLGWLMRHRAASARRMREELSLNAPLSEDGAGEEFLDYLCESTDPRPTELYAEMRTAWERVREIMRHSPPGLWKVIHLLASGYSTVEVARELGVTRQTVYNRKQAIKKVVQQLERGRSRWQKEKT